MESRLAVRGFQAAQEPGQTRAVERRAGRSGAFSAGRQVYPPFAAIVPHPDGHKADLLQPANLGGERGAADAKVRGEVGRTNTRRRIDVGKNAGLPVGEFDGRTSFPMNDVTGEPDLGIRALNAANKRAESHL